VHASSLKIAHYSVTTDGTDAEMRALREFFADEVRVRADNESVGHGSWVKWVNISGWVT